MRTDVTFLCLAGLVLVACADLEPAAATDDVPQRCRVLEASTGTHRLERRPCGDADARALDAAREAADSLQRDQMLRNLPRPGSKNGGS